MFDPQFSPDRKYSIVFYPTEMKMSHWVNRPRLIHTLTDEVLLDLSGSLWHADEVVWDEASKNVSLELRRYPGDVPGVRLNIDLEKLKTNFSWMVDAPEESLRCVLDQLESYYKNKKATHSSTHESQ